MLKNVKLKHLKFYGYFQCDISNYEEYTMIELVNEFCSEVPCFFNSYDHLECLLEFSSAQSMLGLTELSVTFEDAPVQSKISLIIYEYFAQHANKGGKNSCAFLSSLSTQRDSY